MTNASDSPAIRLRGVRHNNLKNFDLDQVIILTHDEEVTPRLAETIRTATLQTFLVTFEGAAKGSTVQADAYFGR